MNAALLGIIISSAVGLWIAYLHRRQLQQNELFRRDPTVGVHPEPTRAGQFLRSNWIWISGLACGVFGIVQVLRLEAVQRPIATRVEMIMIAMNFSLMVFALVSHYTRRTLMLLHDALTDIYARLKHLEKTAPVPGQDLKV